MNNHRYRAIIRGIDGCSNTSILLFLFIRLHINNKTCSWSTNLSILVIKLDWKHLVFAECQFEKRSRIEQISIIRAKFLLRFRRVFMCLRASTHFVYRIVLWQSSRLCELKLCVENSKYLLWVILSLLMCSFLFWRKDYFCDKFLWCGDGFLWVLKQLWSKFYK